MVIEADLSGSDMTKVTLDSLGLNQSLSVLKLRDVSFNPDYINYIFINLSLIKHLSHLDVSNSVLSKVEPILLSDAVTRIFHVNLSCCSLICEHAEFVLDAISDQTKIKQLLLSGNDCKEIDQKIMINALNYLDTFQFWISLHIQ